MFNQSSVGEIELMKRDPGSIPVSVKCFLSHFINMWLSFLNIAILI